MDKPISLVLSIALAVAGMIAVGFIMWTQITNAQEDIEDVNPYSGITTKAVWRLVIDRRSNRGLLTTLVETGNRNVRGRSGSWTPR